MSTESDKINGYLSTNHHNASCTFVFAARKQYDSFREQQENQSRNTRSEQRPKQPSLRPPKVSSNRSDTIKTFTTSFALPTNYDLTIQASKTNSVSKGPYKKPDCTMFRSYDPNKFINGRDFITKFHLHNNQVLRKHCAQDQEGFFNGPNIDPLQPVRYDPKTEGKPDFITQLPNTCNPCGNLQLRLDTTLDQSELFSGGKCITEHKYREEATDKRFITEFNPSGKGFMAVDIGTGKAPPRLIEAKEYPSRHS